MIIAVEEVNIWKERSIPYCMMLARHAVGVTVEKQEFF
jgi:hypothetical protein